MKLIYADVLTGEIQKTKDILQKGLEKDAKFAYMSADSVLKTISNQSTAYDPDKVVEQLKSVSYERYGNDGMGGERVINLDDAIEIVKGGGVDG